MYKHGHKVITTTNKFVKKLKKSESTTINTTKEFVEPELHSTNNLVKGIVIVLVLISMAMVVVFGILIQLGVLK